MLLHNATQASTACRRYLPDALMYRHPQHSQFALLVQASSYLNKLPKSFSKEDKILVADPMLATGEACSSCIFA